MSISFQYNDYIGLMYLRGYYTERYHINLISDEVYNIEGRIFIVPKISEQDLIYVFTGKIQKIKALSKSTEFRLTLFDEKNKEFKDDDFIMLSTIDVSYNRNIVTNIFTRNYATWKFGECFDRGILLDSEKYLMFQGQKPIEKFDIDITNIDLLIKNKVERKNERMLWLE